MEREREGMRGARRRERNVADTAGVMICMDGFEV